MFWVKLLGFECSLAEWPWTSYLNSMPVFPGALVSLLYHEFAPFHLHTGPSDGRYTERGKKQKGPWSHLPGIMISLYREESSPLSASCRFPLLPLAQDILGSWGVRGQWKEINKRKGDSYTLSEGKAFPYLILEPQLECFSQSSFFATAHTFGFLAKFKLEVSKRGKGKMEEESGR